MSKKISEKEEKKLLIFVRVFHKNINKNKKLEPRYFKKLCKIVRDDMICEFLALLTTFTNNESIVIGRAILKNKMENIDELIHFLVSKKSKYHVVLLTCVLLKGRRLTDLDLIKHYVKSFFDDEVGLNFYKLILVLCRKYWVVIDEEILNFCRCREHPVLKETLKEYENKVK